MEKKDTEKGDGGEWLEGWWGTVLLAGGAMKDPSWEMMLDTDCMPSPASPLRESLNLTVVSGTPDPVGMFILAAFRVDKRIK